MEPIDELIELPLLAQLREKILDLPLDDEFLEDKNLIRWLRARNGKVSEAVNMIRKHVQWYKDENIDVALDWRYPPGWKEELPSKITGFDLDGNPVIFEQTGRFDAKKLVDAGMKDEVLRMNNWKLETLWSLVKYVSKDKKELVQGIMVLDLEGLSLRQINSMDTLDLAIKALRVYEANYPETMKYIILLNTSWIFKIGWRILRPFVPERTFSKFRFLGADRSEWKQTLLDIIPQDQIPQYYGGTLDDNVEVQVAKDGSWKMVAVNENIL